jgi:hypothetical protein
MTMSASHSALAQRVAARTGVPASHVEGIMATHGVAAVSTPAARRSMRVLRLRITGTKAASAGGGAFDRSFAFPAGISMVVGSNFVGKPPPSPWPATEPPLERSPPCRDCCSSSSAASPPPP